MHPRALVSLGSAVKWSGSWRCCAEANTSVVGVTIEADADVVEDDRVKHDVFVGAASIGDLRDWKCDALGERRDVASAGGGRT